MGSCATWRTRTKWADSRWGFRSTRRSSSTASKSESGERWRSDWRGSRLPMPLTEKRAREALEKMRHKYRQAREAWELRRRDRELESALFTQGLQHEEIVANEKEIAAD